MAVWTFTQLRKNGEIKKLELSGWAAPFGRPRQEPVVSTPMTVRKSEVYYIGKNEPTVHVFGLKQDDWEIQGRWMDHAGGRGYATKMARYVESFVADQLPVEIAWAHSTQGLGATIQTQIVGAIGLISSFTPSFESASDVAWKMTISIQKNLLHAKKSNPKPKQQPWDSVQSEIERQIAFATRGRNSYKPVNSFPPSLDIGIKEQLDLAVGALNTPLAKMGQSMRQIEDNYEAMASSVRRAKAGVLQVEGIYADLQNTVESLSTDGTVRSTRVQDSMQFWNRQQEFSVDSAIVAQMMLDALDALEREEKGNIKSMYKARTGDTWEKIARLELGDPSRAKEVKDMNDVVSGEPVPGTVYMIPV